MQVCYKGAFSQDGDPSTGTIINVPKTYAYPLLRSVHLSLQPPSSRDSSLANKTTFLTRGDFSYFHYQCDGYPDSGWGCAYRTLQSVCSWLLGKMEQQAEYTNDIEVSIDRVEPSSEYNTSRKVPSLLEIQTILVRVGDKPPGFVGTRSWIGAVEVFCVIHALYNVPCKILHVPHREDLKKYANVLKKYFEDFGGFVMMGGDVDASSKGIAGIHVSGNQAYFLIIDPHFLGKPKSVQELIERGYIRWQHTSEFVDSSFYNLCLPQIK